MFASQQHDWIGNWRGQLIVLVAVGHGAGGAFYLPRQRFVRKVYGLGRDVIYAFNKLVSVFLEDCYLTPLALIYVGGFFMTRMLRLMVAYLVRAITGTFRAMNHFYRMSSEGGWV